MNDTKFAYLKLPLDLVGPAQALEHTHMVMLGAAVQLRGAGYPANAGAVQAIAEAAAAAVAALIAESQKRAAHLGARES